MQPWMPAPPVSVDPAAAAASLLWMVMELPGWRSAVSQEVGDGACHCFNNVYHIQLVYHPEAGRLSHLLVVSSCS